MTTGTIPANILADRVGTQEKALFVDINDDQLRLELMEYKHVAGWVPLERRTIPTWNVFVSGLIMDALGECREPDPRLLLEIGQTRRGPKSISIVQLADHVLESYPWLTQSQLVVINPELRVFGEALASALKIDSVVVEDAGKSWIDNLLQPVNTLPYTLIAFAVDASNPLALKLGIKPFPKLQAGTPLVENRPIVDPLTFYTEPNAEFVLIRLAGRNPATPDKAEDLGTYKVQNPPREITLTATVQYPSPLPSLRIGNLNLERITPEEAREVALPGVTTRPPSLDLMFIIDGTMLPADYDRATWFANNLAHELNSYDTRVAAVVYGEHEHPRGFWDKPPYVTVGVPFGSAANLDMFLHQVKPFDMEHDFADALEVGLADAAKAAWSDRAKCVVIIGNSPPHARATEQKKFGTLNVSTEELTNIDWRTVIKKMRNQKIHVATVWVPPTQTPATPTDLKYAQSLWKVMGEFFYAPTIDDTVLNDLQAKIMEIASADKMLDGVVHWPLLAPWGEHKG